MTQKNENPSSECRDMGLYNRIHNNSNNVTAAKRLTLDEFIDVVVSVKEYIESITATENSTQTAETVQLQDRIRDVG